MRPLTMWALESSVAQLATWRREGLELTLAVNLSARSVFDAQLADDLDRLLARCGVPAGALTLEITESSLFGDRPKGHTALDHLADLGVRLAIDDFGTGYSSLSYLHRFPIDMLKIDRSFVSRLTNSDNGPELASAVITLGETLGLDTVAEGIELEPQVEALLALGCVAGQGFLFAKAGSLEALSKSVFVARRNALWNGHASREQLSVTGRFRALKAIRRRSAGAA
jgi:EAL domain-containing protein (putative c-di-GMP-specific phosphodiesterase class I)